MSFFKKQERCKNPLEQDELLGQMAKREKIIINDGIDASNSK